MQAMTSSLAQRLQHIAPFHVMEIATHARALEATGRDVIHMEIGEPDFPTPQPVIDAAQSLLASGQIYTRVHSAFVRCAKRFRDTTNGSTT
jgi:aspartate/methionine/tyrosine aminotransferase